MQKTNIGQPVPQLPVRDVEKAQRYYNEVLGFEVLWTDADKYIGAVGRKKAVLFFARTNARIEPAVHWIFAEDIDLAYAELKAAGAEIIEELENKPWNMRQFTIRDLNGHIFYIHHDV